MGFPHQSQVICDFIEYPSNLLRAVNAVHRKAECF